MAEHLTHSLALLVRLNEARRIGQRDAATELDVELERHDQRRGFSRSHSVDYGKPVPMHDAGQGPQRNPNWRAALDKLNAMRGRKA